MNLGRLCQIILKSDKEISGYGQLAQQVIFAYHMVLQTPFIALPPLRFPGTNHVIRVVLITHYSKLVYLIVCDECNLSVVALFTKTMHAVGCFNCFVNS